MHVLTCLFPPLNLNSLFSLAFAVKNFPGIIIAEEAGWKDCIEGSNAVVNLAGMPISTRWSPEVGLEADLFILDLYYVAG